MPLTETKNLSFETEKQRDFMVNFIICDDDVTFALQLKNAVELALQRNNARAKVHTFYSAETIGSEVFSDCDIAFLDIDFTGKKYNGLDIARKLRAVRDDAVIVFVTNYIEYAPAGYEVQAFRYLLKNQIPEKLDDNINQILANIRKSKSSVKIQVDREWREIFLKDLLYIESMGHTLIFHILEPSKMTDKEIVCHIPLAKMEDELSERGFLRVHKSYLVNMAHIKQLTYNEAILDNGHSLRVSSRTYGESKKKYMLWRGQQ